MILVPCADPLQHNHTIIFHHRHHLPIPELSSRSHVTEFPQLLQDLRYKTKKSTVNLPTRQAVCVERNSEARSRNYCCRVKAMCYIFVFVRARAGGKCMRVCARECWCGCTGAGVCLRACSLNNRSRNVPPYCRMAYLAPSYFSTLSHKRHDFRKKSFWTQNVSFHFLNNFYLYHFSFWELRYIVINVKTSSNKADVILVGFE